MKGFRGRNDGGRCKRYESKLSSKNNPEKEDLKRDKTGASAGR